MKNILFKPKRYVWGLVLLSPFHPFTLSLFAQTPVTLPEAVRLAETNRPEIRSALLQTEIQASDEGRRRAQNLPQVTAGADFRWNTQIQRNIIRNAPFANGQDVVLRFGTPINNVLNAQVEQRVFNPQARVDRELNRINAEGQQAALALTRQDVRSQVTEAYYLAVFNREKRRLSAQARERALRYVEQAQTRFSAGTLLQTDLDRFALDLRNADLTVRNDERDYALSLDNLRYRTGSTGNVAPADSLATLLGTAVDNVASGVDAPDVAGRIELRQEDLTRQANLLTARRELAKLQPTVTAYGAYFAQQFADTFNPFLGGTWFPYNYVGLRVAVPLFDGGQARLTRQDYVRRAEVNQNNVARLRADYDYALRSAQNTVAQARDNLEQTQLNIRQAQQILAVDRVRFGAGTLLLADFRNSEYSLQQAENNYLRAVYDLLIGQLQVRRATGNL